MNERLTANYNENNEDRRVFKDSVQRLEFLTTMTYLKNVLPLPTTAHVLDACAGIGTYAFALAKIGYKVTAGDLMKDHVSQLLQKQQEKPLLQEIYTGDIRNLYRFKDNTFDAVLAFGAFYRMMAQLNREAALRECLRVLKPGGIMAATYINRHAHLLHGLSREGVWGFQKYMGVIRTGVDNDCYFSAPSEMEDLYAKYAVQILHHIGVDGMSYVLADVLNHLKAPDFTKWLEYHVTTCENPYLLGYSLHGLLIGRKAEK